MAKAGGHSAQQTPVEIRPPVSLDPITHPFRKEQMADPTSPPPFPGFSEAQLAYLERVHPDRCPNVADTEREVWMKAGAASVHRSLRARMKKPL